MKSKALLLVIVTMMSAVMGTAQAGIIVGAPASGSNAFPFGGTFDANPNRYQQVYSSTAFASNNTHIHNGILSI